MPAVEDNTSTSSCATRPKPRLGSTTATRASKPMTNDTSKHNLTWSLVVPTIRGWDGPLRNTWLSVCEAAAHANAEILVVFDAPGQYRPPPLPTALSARVITTGGGAGYAGACNAGLLAAHGQLTFFLNDDVILPPDVLHELEKAWHGSDRPGAVVPDVWSEILGRSESGCRLSRRHGLLDSFQDPLDGREQVDYPCGAAVAMETHLIRSIGGWETVYAPGYWEDVDLGLRLGAMGLSVRTVAHIQVRHLHGQSMSRRGSRANHILYERNRVLCSLKNLSEASLPRFLGWVAIRGIAGLLRDRAVFLGSLAALRQFPRILR